MGPGRVRARRAARLTLGPNPFRRDLILLHAPALYDFRTRGTILGPLADAVPSTAIFEMYPVGLTSIAAFLERNHCNVEIVNLAYRMLQDRHFDVESYATWCRASSGSATRSPWC